MTVAQLLAALASPDPTPGGGTAAAIAGAMGTSLLVMVPASRSRRTTPTRRRRRWRRRARRSSRSRRRLMELADADTRAFNDVMAAYRLPKATDEDKAARTRGDSGGAARRHRGPARDAARLRRGARRTRDAVADYGNRSAASDVGVAIGLLKAAAEGAAANVRINLGGLEGRSVQGRADARRRDAPRPTARRRALALAIRVDVDGVERPVALRTTPGTSTTFVGVASCRPWRSWPTCADRRCRRRRSGCRMSRPASSPCRRSPRRWRSESNSSASCTASSNW